jgi:hypothetical protein
MYASLAELKTWLELPADDEGAQDHHLEPVLLAADRWIDQACGRHFELEQGVTKLYYPREAGWIDVVDLVTATSIKFDSSGDRTYHTTLSAADYELLPYIDDAGRPAVRFQRIRIWPTSSSSFAYGELVQIVGDFGYVIDGQAPPEIRLASLILASRYWKRHETPLGILGATDLGTFERISKADPDVVALLQPYTRAGSAWVLV